MINVGIIGCGFVGGALKAWLENNNPDCKLFISDPAKGYNDDMSQIDIAFLQIPVCVWNYHYLIRLDAHISGRTLRSPQAEIHIVHNMTYALSSQFILLDMDLALWQEE